MADLPLPEELVGNSVTESQFKDALVRLITGITAYLDEHGTEIDASLNNALGTFLDAVQSYKDDVDNRIPYSPFNDEILFEFADAEGKVVFQINRDGSALFTGLQESIQKEILNIFEKIQNNISGNICELIDPEGNIVFAIDSEARVYIPGIESDLATVINTKAENGLSPKNTANLSNYSYRDTFIPKAQNLLNFFRNNHDVGLLAPVPLQSFKQNFSIGTDWINQANIAEWGDYIPVKTPYGNDRGVVHPQILEFPNRFMGCRYILAITGYTNGNTREENPFLLGSNDLQNFELLTPLIDEPVSYTWEKGIVYNSDPFMFYDIKTGELCLIFREYWADTDGIAPNETFEKLFVRRSKDGLVWSDREILNDQFPLLAPAIIFDAHTETYHLYGVDNGIKHYTSRTAKNDWELVGTIPSPVDKSPWHVDVKWIGDKQVIVVHDRIWSPASKNRGFFLGIASNFHNFTWASNFWNMDERGVYKATFLPQFNENNEMRLMCLWTSDSSPTDANLRYKLFVQPTPFLNVDFLEK